MSTIFILLYINLHSGIGFFYYTCQKFGKIHTIFASLPLDTIYVSKNPISKFSKNGSQNPQLNVIGSTIKNSKFCHIWICWEWITDVTIFGSITKLSDMECCAFVRHLVIKFAKTGKTLKLPKMECFWVQTFPLLVTFRLARSWQFQALKHTSSVTCFYASIP